MAEKPGLAGMSLCMTRFTSSHLDSSANIKGAGEIVPLALAEIGVIKVEVICNVTSFRFFQKMIPPQIPG